MNNNTTIPKDALLEGCYHEIGHIISAFLCFPDKEIVQCFGFYKTYNGGYKFDVRTNPDSIKFHYTQLELYAIFCLSGGIFQQMAAYLTLHQTGYCDFNEIESCIVDSDKALEMFFYRMVKAKIDGMENDYDQFEKVNAFVAQQGLPSVIDYEAIKFKAIHLLFPFLFSKKIKDLSETCVQIIMEKLKRRPPSIEFDMAFLRPFLLESGVIK